ncbi:hypothetical protein CJ030_MR6G018074 [Morella rubra]|uniref:Ribosomal RNA-processing protein 7 C-terminal domain-containing protein n=1 Tax=Morella rubra TaxID=262757 RepID=A0A6A1VH01_9ROSI|nr:hypothetical protein CJ030_MR6G018074 [Morella rubra]
MDSQKNQKKKKKQKIEKLHKRNPEMPAKDHGVTEKSHFQTKGEIECTEGLRGTDVETEIIPRKPKKTKRKKKEDRSPSEKGKKSHKKGEADQDEVCHLPPGDEDCSERRLGNSKKKARIKRKKYQNLSMEAENSKEEGGEAGQDDVYQISSGDEDCSKGMQKWITEYHQSRPGLMVLQQNIDDFITAHEERQEQERKEREAQAAEGGWTVVVHHKGRKKTTDAESGVTVGSVAQAAVEDKMARKKHKEVGLNFYRFQRREAQRNEIMMLQSKFEQDKKQIQELRAARKFRPY